MPTPKSKKESQSLLEILQYLSKYFLAMPESYELLRRLTSVKCEWTWKKTYQDLYSKAKALIRKDVCIKCYSKNWLYWETDTLWVGLLQVWDGKNCPKDTAPDNTILRFISFTFKNVSNAKTHYGNTEMTSTNHPTLLREVQRLALFQRDACNHIL